MSQVQCSPEMITRPRRGCKPNLTAMNFLSEYSSRTTVHGLSYIYDSTSSLLDRCLWLAICLSFAFLAVFMSAKAYIDWHDDPVTTTLLTTGRKIIYLWYRLSWNDLRVIFTFYNSSWFFIGKPIGEIQHPSITICSQGWIPSVTANAMIRQFETYAESKGMDLSNMTSVEQKQAELSMISGNVSWYIIRHKIILPCGQQIWSLDKLYIMSL